jgi:hypothetical protein
MDRTIIASRGVTGITPFRFAVETDVRKALRIMEAVTIFFIAFPFVRRHQYDTTRAGRDKRVAGRYREPSRSPFGQWTRRISMA